MFDMFKRDKAAPGKPWSERLKEGLARSREKLGGAIATALRRPVLDEETIEAIETALLTADVGVAATATLIADLRTRWKRSGGEGDPKSMLKASLVELLAPLEKPLVVAGARPFVIMLAGVNGAGKTTSIGKLAKILQAEGHSVLLAAGDTFRAAAREQLAVWGERNGVAVIAQAGGDPAAVMFDAIGAAKSRGIDVVLADTAGRLADPAVAHGRDPQGPARHPQDRRRRHRTRRCSSSTPIPARTRSRRSARSTQALGLTGIVLTKLDGTAKGGIVAAIAREHPVPVRFIGVGEGVDDLKPFVAADFVDALVG